MFAALADIPVRYWTKIAHDPRPALARLSFVIADGNLLSVYGRLEWHLASPPLFAPDMRLCATDAPLVTICLIFVLLTRTFRRSIRSGRARRKAESRRTTSTRRRRLGITSCLLAYFHLCYQHGEQHGAHERQGYGREYRSGNRGQWRFDGFHGHVSCMCVRRGRV